MVLLRMRILFFFRRINIRIWCRAMLTRFTHLLSSVAQQINRNQHHLLFQQNAVASKITKATLFTPIRKIEVRKVA